MKGAVKILLAVFSLVYHMFTRTWSVIRFCQIGDVRGALCSPNISDLTSDIITAVFNPVVTVKLIFVTKEQKFNAINVTDWLNIFDNVLIVLWFICIEGWSHGCWIYNYLYNQCPSPLMWVWILLMARCTRYNIMW